MKKVVYCERGVADKSSIAGTMKSTCDTIKR
jgi:hypothetical protein